MKIKGMQKILYLGLIAWLPFMLFLHWATDNDEAAMAAAIAYLLLWGINGVRLGKSECPFCGEKYFLSESRIAVGNVWALRCRHCKKSVWQRRR